MMRERAHAVGKEGIIAPLVNQEGLDAMRLGALPRASADCIRTAQRRTVGIELVSGLLKVALVVKGESHARCSRDVEGEVDGVGKGLLARSA
jgi:hypothetical protein